MIAVNRSTNKVSEEPTAYVARTFSSRNRITDVMIWVSILNDRRMRVVQSRLDQSNATSLVFSFVNDGT